jgi:hypothetical protein
VPPICNANAVITCPHQAGMAKAGAPIVGCPNLPTPGTPTFVPCLTVVAPAVMGSTKVMIGGVPALLANSMMTTNCVVPVPNGATVKVPGQFNVMANG